FTPADCLEMLRAQNRDLGLVVDLTFSDRYYDGREFSMRGVEVIKIRECGHGVIPNRKNVVAFMNLVKAFTARKPDKYIAVHCTHGLNRSGYYIVSFLIEVLHFTLEQAMAAFTQASPPGLWDNEYILALYKQHNAG
ncbi:hypothetical protein GUITHDRAFT_45804, partial [Guillardia theta CCMP2712]